MLNRLKVLALSAAGRRPGRDGAFGRRGTIFLGDAAYTIANLVKDAIFRTLAKKDPAPIRVRRRLSLYLESSTAPSAATRLPSIVRRSG